MLIDKKKRKVNMSLGVQQFLNDSGGNFTETAPRPPVPGEENDATERHSTGGGSTRSSSGSHKSHLSNKSHASAKSGVSHRSEHSPAATPRRSNLDKTSAGVSTSTSGVDLEHLAAPLGFEPEGSVANSPPFTENSTTENSTPPYLRWAENLKYLLDDGDGVKLFKQFLDNEQCSSFLDFWFACQGLKMVSSDDSRKVQNLVKLIYRKYIKGDLLNLSPVIKGTITDKMKAGDLEQTIFDAAQIEVENIMRNDSYPLFLKSDLYVQYVQTGGESPKTSNTSSGSNSVRPLSGPLPTLNEGEELRQEDIGKNNTSQSSTLQLTRTALLATSYSRANMKSKKSEGIFPHPTAPAPQASGRKHKNPYHISYAPVSAQDSEIQSLSSDALTDDTMSLTDSSVDGREKGKKWKQRKMHRPLNPNQASTNFIPRPDRDRAPKDRNIAETDPRKFAEMLIERLERVQDEQEKLERMQERFSRLELTDEEDVSMMKPPHVVNTSVLPGQLHTSMVSHNVSLVSHPNQSMMSHINSSMAHHNQSLVGHHNQSMASHHNQSAVSHHNQSAANSSMLSQQHSKSSLSSLGSVQALIATAMAEQEVQDESAQSILEEHCSRIWDSSAGQTPSRSPGRSPDRGPTSRHGPIAPVYKGLYAKQRSKADKDNAPHLMSTSSFDSGMEGSGIYHPDSVSAPGAGSLDPHSAKNKHIHHHHHHHYHKDSSSARSSKSQDPNESRGSRGGYYNSDPNMSWDEGSRGRSRDAKRSAAKKQFDTSSNIDSGVSVYDSVAHAVPNMQDPSNGKVLAWMLENEKFSTGTSHSTDSSDKGSSHKRSHKSGVSSHSARAGSSKKGYGGSSSRPTSLDRSSHELNTSHLQPSQPIAQDQSMPLLNPPHTTTQLEEAKRRLEDEKLRHSMSKSKSFGASGSLKDGRQMLPPRGYPPRTLNVSRTLPGSTGGTNPLDLSGESESSMYRNSALDRSSSKSSSKKPSSSAPTTPAGGSDVTIVGYYFCGEPIPYRSTIRGKNVTLDQFKALITKRGNYRYFFKKASDEFDSGVILEEVTEDDAILPLWEGKIVGKVEKVE